MWRNLSSLLRKSDSANWPEYQTSPVELWRRHHTFHKGALNQKILCQVFERFLQACATEVCYIAVFSVVTQRWWGGALRDDSKNGCLADYIKSWRKFQSRSILVIRSSRRQETLQCLNIVLKVLCHGRPVQSVSFFFSFDHPWHLLFLLCYFNLPLMF